MFPILDLSSFQLCFRTDLKCYIEKFPVMNGKQSPEITINKPRSTCFLGGDWTRGCIATTVSKRIEQSQSTNFNKIQDDAWLNSSCVYNQKFQNVPYLEFSQFSAMF